MKMKRKKKKEKERQKGMELLFDTTEEIQDEGEKKRYSK